VEDNGEVLPVRGQDVGVEVTINDNRVGTLLKLAPIETVI
jgi:hypothetical protein